MTEIALFEAKNRLSELIDRVQAGEEFIITRRGKVVARLARPEADDERRQALGAIAGLRAAREGATLDGISARGLIDEGRR